MCRFRLDAVFFAAWAILSPFLTDAQPPPDVSIHYPLSGYWLFGRSQVAQWPGTLDRIKRLGADTVIQFGPRPALRTLAEIRAHPIFANCPVDSHETNGIRNLYTLETQENFGSALLVRPPIDRRIETDGHIFWKLRLSVSPPPGAVSNKTSALQDDLIFVSGRKTDSLSSLLDQASKRSMSVYVGMPCAMADPKHPWDPDAESLPVLLELTRRILSDYEVRYSQQTSFAGVYQSLETPVSRTCLTSVLRVYRAQHAEVRKKLPGKRILISPYWDVRKTNLNGTDAASIKAGIRLLALQNVDVIAPQDSRGTGKVGLFWPHQTNTAVDARLEPSVGRISYGDAYRASTTDLYRAAREALDEAAERDGLKTELWANIEAFEPCASNKIQRTSHERLDQAIMFAGIYPSKLICFMWDNYFTATAGQPLSLGEEIENALCHPILVHVRQANLDGKNGMALLGYGLEQTTARIVFTDPQGIHHSVDLPVTPVPTNRITTFTHPLPEKLQTVWIPYDLAQLTKGTPAELTLIRGVTGCFHPYVLHRD